MLFLYSEATALQENKQFNNKIFNFLKKKKNTTQSHLHIQCNSYPITNGIFPELKQKILHIVCKPKRPWIGKAIVRKKNGDRWINLTNFRLHYKKLQRQRLYYTKSIYIQRLYYKAITKTIWYWHKNKNTAKKNRTETPEINPCTHEYFIFLKGGRNIQWRKDSLLAGKTEQLHVSEWN